MKRTYESLRSAAWMAKDDLRSFGHRSRMMQMGYGPDDWAGRPIIAIINTWSDLNPCHSHFKQRVEDVKRGVFQAGGFPVELPAISVSESFVKPTTMLYRNMLAMEAEELLRSHPVDGAVLLGGCDKTTPGLLMGAISAGLPCVYVPAGPMLRGNWKGKILGSGSDAWKLWDERRAGKITQEQWTEVEGGIARSYGTCMTMGTASTMTAIAEAIGMTLPGASSIPAADVNHMRMSAECGRRVVEMVWDDLTPQRILTLASFKNAINVAMAMGCSTNAIIHRWPCRAAPAIRWAWTTSTPPAARCRSSPTSGPAATEVPDGRLLLRRRPAGADVAPGRPPGPVGHDRHRQDAGREHRRRRGLQRRCHPQARHRHLRRGRAGGPARQHRAGRLRHQAQRLRPQYLRHTGPALVFDDYPSMKAAVDDENLDVTADHIMILRNAGPQGGPGMPEWGMLPIPTKLVKQGVRDMLRLSDARMSGTSYGACILHAAPEAYIGGPLALVKTGDLITVDVPARSIHLNVSDEELAARRAAWTPPPKRYERGYGWMYSQHILQADEGCDFDFLETSFGAPVPEPEIF